VEKGVSYTRIHTQNNAVQLEYYGYSFHRITASLHQVRKDYLRFI